MDPAELTAFLHAGARSGDSATYAEALAALGLPFSRPKMRALCVLLDDIDAAERGAGRPPLAVLVVRQSDGLPGQGWWLGQAGYAGPFTGPAAAAWVRARQAEVFAHWATRSAPPPIDGSRPGDGNA